jgi:hypothetical protein
MRFFVFTRVISLLFSRALIIAKFDKKFQQRMQALEALERSKKALTSASSRHFIGVVEHKYQSVVLIQLHYRLHRRRVRLARFHAYTIGGQAAAAAHKICKFFRTVLVRRRPPPLPPLMRLRTLNRSMPRLAQAMSLQRAAGDARRGIS